MKAGERETNTAVGFLKRGGVVAYPTDTVYGLGVDATNCKAVKRLLQIKERGDKAISIMVSNIEEAIEFVEFSDLALEIAGKFLPGALTLVLPLQNIIPESIRHLSANTSTLGIRIPNNVTAIEMVKRLGKPITTTSANPRGEMTPLSIKDCLEQFERNKKDCQPDFYLDEGVLENNPPSTIVKIVRNDIEIIREGQISLEEIMEVR